MDIPAHSIHLSSNTVEFIVKKILYKEGWVLQSINCENEESVPVKKKKKKI